MVASQLRCPYSVGVERLRIRWDPDKDGSNRRKHGVSFAEACTVFADECALLLLDPDHSEDEERFLLLGLGASLRTLVVAHCFRERTGVIRIISARRATRLERARYAGQRRG